MSTNTDTARAVTDTLITSAALRHPKVQEFAQAISRADQTGNMDIIRLWMTQELATFVSSGIYGQSVFEVATISASDFLQMVRDIVRHDAEKAAGSDIVVAKGKG